VKKTCSSLVCCEIVGRLSGNFQITYSEADLVMNAHVFGERFTLLWELQREKKEFTSLISRGLCDCNASLSVLFT